ncbi:MAG: zinc ribbon domain-containing protein [Verrucomicrobiales bacterium]|nr:zinc ribbon domain-containing protein [Verrucomicrobiales bacterium]
MDVFFESSQNSRIDGASQTARDARSTARDAEREVAALQRRVDFLTIASQALWEIVRERMGLSDQQILERIKEIDLRDGKADGKISKSIQPCPQCHRNNQSGQSRCVYCGTELPIGRVFDRS